MCKREYYQTTLRLKSIRAEIEILKNEPINSIQKRIQVLKETNLLLKEQNSILVSRQEFLAIGDFNSYLKTG